MLGGPHHGKLEMTFERILAMLISIICLVKNRFLSVFQQLIAVVRLFEHLNCNNKIKCKNSPLSSEGYTNVGDGCWIRNVLVTTIRCWWWFWSFLHKIRAPTFKRYHQHRNSVPNIHRPSPTLNQQHPLVTNIHFSPTSL